MIYENSYIYTMNINSYEHFYHLIFRRMIKKTQLEIGDYASEVYSLEKIVSECNKGYKELGYGVILELI